MKRWLFFMFLSGCTLGPDYETPSLCLPSNYKESSENTKSVDLGLWWKQFEDPLLDELIQEALSCNYDLQIALHKIEEVRALYKIQRSSLYPQIQGNMAAIKSRRSASLSSDIIETPGIAVDLLPTDFTGPLVQYFFQLGFDASWEIDLFGKNRRKEQAAYYDFEANQENALGVQITLVSDVARVYIDIRSLQQRIHAKQEQIDRQKEIVKLANSRYLAGLNSYLDVTRAVVALEEEEATLPLLQEELQQAMHALAALLGKFPENFSLEEGIIPKALGRIPNNLPSDLLLRRPDIRQAERELAAATARIGEAKAELFPSFSLTGSFGTQTNTLNQLLTWPSRFWSIGPSMIWNLFTGGKLLAQIQVTNEREKQAILRYENIITNALKEVEDRLTGYFKEEKRLISLEEKLSSTSLTRDLTYAQYFAGLISLDEVLDVEREFFQSQENMIESEGVTMLQLVGLYKALGGGWAFEELGYLEE